MRAVFVFLLAFFILPFAAVAAEKANPYGLPPEFLGLWESNKRDIPYAYRFNPDGTIDLISENENETTHYKFIFQDKDGTAYFLWKYKNAKVFIATLEIHPAEDYRPQLLKMTDSHCRMKPEDWDHPPVSKLKADILVKTVEPYDQDCMDFGSEMYYRRP